MVSGNHLHNLGALTAGQVEALVSRMTRFDEDFDEGTLRPRKIVRFDLPRCVTWTCIVLSQWMLVASSDNHSSVMSCWDISKALQGDTKPVSTWYLPGPVHTGKTHAQSSGVIVALGLGRPVYSTQLLKLELGSSSDHTTFQFLKEFQGAVHVTLLTDSLLCCARYRDINQLHFINWQEESVYSSDPQPSDNHQGAALCVILWRELLIAVGRTDVDIYSLPDGTKPPSPLYSASFPFFAWTVIALSPSFSGSEEQCFLVVGEDDAMQILRVTATFEVGGKPVCNCKIEPLATKCAWEFEQSAPSHAAAVGHSGKLIMWTGLVRSTDDRQFASLISMALSSADKDAPDSVRAKFMDCAANVREELPALWAIAKLDLDDEQGLALVGNIFGELALIDFVPGNLEVCPSESSGPKILHNDPAPICSSNVRS
ncbi:hypothetical protein HWV62_6229 [Athelia sp. TMB]|nr:hypothetical protein HWV62_6229 [Athelia sp. TMB]